MLDDASVKQKQTVLCLISLCGYIILVQAQGQESRDIRGQPLVVVLTMCMYSSCGI